MSFSSREVFISVLFAVVFGVCYFLYFFLHRLLISRIRGIKSFVVSVLFYESLLQPITRRYGGNEKHILSGIVDILVFGVGFIFLSYVALDGALRFYMLILSFAAFYLSNFAFFEFLSRILNIFFDYLELCVLIFIRIIIFPIRQLIKKCQKMFNKFHKMGYL